jgi:hypothetical protein
VESALYLAQIYWPYALGALVIGVGVGWFSYKPKK